MAKLVVYFFVPRFRSFYTVYEHENATKYGNYTGALAGGIIESCGYIFCREQFRELSKVSVPHYFKFSFGTTDKASRKTLRRHVINSNSCT